MFGGGVRTRVQFRSPKPLGKFTLLVPAFGDSPFHIVTITDERQASNQRTSMINWRPLPGGMEYSQDAYLVDRGVVNQNVVFVNHQLSRSSDATNPAESGMVK